MHLLHSKYWLLSRINHTRNRENLRRKDFICKKWSQLNVINRLVVCVLIYRTEWSFFCRHMLPDLNPCDVFLQRCLSKINCWTLTTAQLKKWNRQYIRSLFQSRHKVWKLFYGISSPNFDSSSHCKQDSTNIFHIKDSFSRMHCNFKRKYNRL